MFFIKDHRFAFPAAVLRLAWVTAMLVSAIAFSPARAADALPAQCLQCHPETLVLERVSKMPADQRAVRLEAFLPKHYAPDEAQRRAIIAELMAKTKKP